MRAERPEKPITGRKGRQRCFARNTKDTTISLAPPFPAGALGNVAVLLSELVVACLPQQLRLRAVLRCGHQEVRLRACWFSIARASWSCASASSRAFGLGDRRRYFDGPPREVHRLSDGLKRHNVSRDKEADGATTGASERQGRSVLHHLRAR
jgi:hypothetical protein